MIKNILPICLLIFLLFSKKTYASMVEINASYISDTMTTSSDVVTTRVLGDFALGIHISKKMYIALAGGSFTATDQTSTTTTLVATDTGLRLGYVFGKQKNFNFSVTYNFIGKATYKAGTASEVELRGTSLRSDIGYNYWIGDSTALVLKIFYYAPSFTESVSGTTLTTINYKRTTIAPGLSLYYEF